MGRNSRDQPRGNPWASPEGRGELQRDAVLKWLPKLVSGRIPGHST